MQDKKKRVGSAPEKKYVVDAKMLDQVRVMSQYRLPLTQQRHILGGMAKSTWDILYKTNPDFRTAVDEGRAVASMKARETLFQMAVKDKNFQALKFWCQTQEGFKITTRIESDQDGDEPRDVTNTEEQKLIEFNKIAQQLKDSEE